MSDVMPFVAVCPRCAAEQATTVFKSLNAELIPLEVEAILAGTFEVIACPVCGHRFQPQHTMLFLQFAAGVWIVMHPPSDRAHFATLERGVELVLQREFAEAPRLVGERLGSVRPRLVFGQHMLAEAVRCVSAGIDAAVLECAKMLLIRRNLQGWVGQVPCELCWDGAGEAGELLLGAYALEGGERVAEPWRLSREVMEEASASRDAFATLHPELFNRPYVSALRYLYGATE
jgi:hypothetical protein